MVDRYEPFRAELEADRRAVMRAAVRSELARVRSERRPIPVQLVPEGRTLSLTSSSHRQHPLFLASACVLLVAIGVAVLVAVSGDDPNPAEIGSGASIEPTPSSSTPAVPGSTSTAASTTTPSTTMPSTTTPSTTMPPTTSPPTPSTTPDVGVAVPGIDALNGALIPPDAWGEGWTVLDPATEFRAVTFEPAVMSRQCSTYESDVYGPLAQAGYARRVWLTPAPDFAQHHLFVVATVDEATTAFAALTAPAFHDCARTQGRMFEALKTPLPLDAPFAVDADESVFYRYDRDLSPDVTRSYSAVLARVGRVIVYVDTFTGLNGGDTEATVEQLSANVAIAVEAARALAG